jgi:DNA-binding NtrC family response regulator
MRSRRRDDLRAQLERLLRECRGNISMIAERLQRDRATVTYHLKKLGLFERQGSGRGASLRATRTGGGPGGGS